MFALLRCQKRHYYWSFCSLLFKYHCHYLSGFVCRGCFIFHWAAMIGQPRISACWENTRIGKKIIQMSSIFLIRCKIRNDILAPREEQDGDPSHGIPHPRAEVLHPSHGIHKISGGMTSFSSCGIAFRGCGITFCRRGIEHQILARVMVQYENLW